MSKVPVHTTNSGVLQFHTVSTLTLDGGQLHKLFTLPLGKDPSDPTNRRLGEQSQSGHFGEEKSVSSMSGITPSFLGCQDTSTGIPSALPWLLFIYFLWRYRNWSKNYFVQRYQNWSNNYFVWRYRNWSNNYFAVCFLSLSKWSSFMTNRW